jgi:hypothetical protein
VQNARKNSNWPIDYFKLAKRNIDAQIMEATSDRAVLQLQPRYPVFDDSIMTIFNDPREFTAGADEPLVNC